MASTGEFGGISLMIGMAVGGWVRPSGANRCPWSRWRGGFTAISIVIGRECPRHAGRVCATGVMIVASGVFGVYWFCVVYVYVVFVIAVCGEPRARRSGSGPRLWKMI